MAKLVAKNMYEKNMSCKQYAISIYFTVLSGPNFSQRLSGGVRAGAEGSGARVEPRGAGVARQHHPAHAGARGAGAGLACAQAWEGQRKGQTLGVH